MQFNQPGFFNYGQPFSFNNPYQFNGYPEVVGEGNVTSVMSPDGSMQLLFLPTTQWWRPYPCNINAGNVNYNNWNPTGAWFIRSVFSPIQPIPYQVQPLQAPSGIAFPRTHSSDCCVSQPACPPSNFELKFHNDICTSTSDIHCFYPSLRSVDWLKKPKGCVSVQVDAPMLTSSVYQRQVCTKPSNCCTPMDQTENTAKVKCYPQKPQTSFSDTSMSCDTDKSRDCVCCKDAGKKERKEKKKSKPKKKTKSKVKCECELQKTSEKCISTVADQACGGVEDRGRETQTACARGKDTQTSCEIVPLRMVASGSTCKKEIQAEVLKPKRSSKKVLKTKSSENLSGVYESDCCSGTCSCYSDTN